MPAQAIRVKNLRELNIAFALADKRVRLEFRGELRNASEPVRADAQRLAASEITNIGDKWSKMRVGITRKSVYVAPTRRGVKSRGASKLRRPNLAGLLMDRAMQPALDRNISEVERRIDN